MLLTITMHEYRVTKYDPAKRNEKGWCLDDDWTGFGEVGHKCSLGEYLDVENAYLNSAIEFISNSQITALQINSIENRSIRCNFEENQLIPVDSLEPILRSMLREDFFCKLESDKGFIHVGWDYYMYLGVTEIEQITIDRAIERGLFVEEFISPYKDC